MAEQQEYRARASVSGPLADTLSARLSGYYNNVGGTIHNITYDRDVNGHRDLGARGLYRQLAQPGRDGWTPPAMASGFNSEFPQEEAAEGASSAEEALVAPLPAGEPNFVFHASPTEDTGALINTVLPDGTATLVSGTHLPGVLKNPAALADRRRITLAIAIAVAIVGLLLGLISLL